MRRVQVVLAGLDGSIAYVSKSTMQRVWTGLLHICSGLGLGLGLGFKMSYLYSAVAVGAIAMLLRAVIAALAPMYWDMEVGAFARAEGAEILA